MSKVLKNAAELKGYIISVAKKKKRLTDISVIILLLLWVCGFIYILYLSIQYPANAVIYLMAVAISSEGVGSTSLAFTRLRKSWDQMYLDEAEKIVNSRKKKVKGEFDNRSEAENALIKYAAEIGSPFRHATQKQIEKSLEDFCENAFKNREKIKI
ncbi:hypothetical protein ACNF42_07855 [Cuniculiplasma sp. SKW3]|uniref:hypothetical protein n=1 Tax=Cuniculiplasma sp. SKW3 TaxID=3400170 RepID=UPI003FD2C12F